MTQWVVDPTTGRGVAVNDEAAAYLAGKGWRVYVYDNQDAGLSQLGYDPNAAAAHQILGDQVLVYNAQTGRYEMQARAVVDAQNAATNAYGAVTGRAATAADIIAASRGPENAFQYANALHGQPDAAGIGIFDALAGRIGGATGAGTPSADQLEPIDIMGRVGAIVNRSFGTGGEGGSGQSAWADAAGMAPTEAEQRAVGAVAGVQEAQQAPPEAGGTAVTAPVGGGPGLVYSAALGRWIPQIPDSTATAPAMPGGQAGQVYSPEMGRWVDGPLVYADAMGRGVTPPGGGAGKIWSPEMGRWVDSASGAGAQVGAYTPNPMGRADAQLVAPMTPYGPSQAAYDPFTGKVDTSQYEPATGLSGKGKSDIAWKNKLTALVGKGSEARSAAYKKAGMSGAEFNRIVKHGGDPFKKKTVKAEHGMLDVITGPTTIHAGEGGKDEIHIVIPMEQADQPVPRALLALANQLSPDLDSQRGIGGVVDAPSLPAAAPMPPLGGAMPPLAPPAGDPILDMAQRPDGSYAAAQGGGLAVLGGSTTVKQANSPANAAGQVKVPYGKKTRMVPVTKTTPLPDFGSLPPALLSLISPSSWKLIGSQYGAAGGRAEDIPFLLTRGLKGLGRAPAAFGGRIF